MWMIELRLRPEGWGLEPDLDPHVWLPYLAAAQLPQSLDPRCQDLNWSLEAVFELDFLVFRPFRG